MYYGGGKTGKYLLKCLSSNAIIQDQYTLHYQDGALLQAVYEEDYKVDESQSGLWKFHHWLPVTKPNDLVSGSRVYKAEALGKSLGLEELWVAFHGYWPERNGMCKTGSFKDLEAVPTIQRLVDHECSGIICASAGNTARAFTYHCGLAKIPLIVVVGQKHKNRIWVPHDHPTDSIQVIVLEDGDYQDAKDVAKALGGMMPNWQLEGGVHNVARRDGIGSLMLEAHHVMEGLPAHYFQAVSGGPGPIGVHEMASRIINSVEDESRLPVQHVAQNEGHAPIHSAWQDEREQLNADDFPNQIPEVFSDYLVNLSPAYGIKGGMHEVLSDSNGHTYAITTQEAQAAKALFEKIEGIDIMSPGAVALAALQQAVEKQIVHPNERILLNISGGGVERFKRENEWRVVEPLLVISKKEAMMPSIIERLEHR